MLGINTLVSAVGLELSRAITGRLFSDDQIRAVTKSAIGKYFADWLPEPEDQRTARERVEDARLPIAKASSIITQMQQELSQQSTQLDKLLVEVEEKKKLAEQYGHLAATNQQQFAAFRTEIEEVLRKELVAQAEKGKGLRQTASLAIWVFTLVLGAALGTYFKEILAWAKALVA